MPNEYQRDMARCWRLRAEVATKALLKIVHTRQAAVLEKDAFSNIPSVEEEMNTTLRNAAFDWSGDTLLSVSESVWRNVAADGTYLGLDDDKDTTSKDPRAD